MTTRPRARKRRFIWQLRDATGRLGTAPDPGRPGAVPDEGELPVRGGIDHRVDEPRLERVGRLVAVQEVPLLDGPLDRPAGGVTVQVLDPDVVREQPRDAALEPVELRESVLADRDEEVDAQVLVVDDLRELLRERPLAFLVGVVEEVVLELVEDHE